MDVATAKAVLKTIQQSASEECKNQANNVDATKFDALTALFVKTDNFGKCLVILSLQFGNGQADGNL